MMAAPQVSGLPPRHFERKVGTGAHVRAQCALHAIPHEVGHAGLQRCATSMTPTQKQRNQQLGIGDTRTTMLKKCDESRSPESQPSQTCALNALI